MSQIRTLLVVVWTLALTNAQASDAVRCPGALSWQTKVFRLDGMHVFDGPPEELADLVPDRMTSSWDIGPSQRGAARRGAAVYVTCLYEGTGKVWTLRVPRHLRFCRMRKTEAGIVAGCGNAHDGFDPIPGRR